MSHKDLYISVHLLFSEMPKIPTLLNRSKALITQCGIQPDVCTHTCCYWSIQNRNYSTWNTPSSIHALGIINLYVIFKIMLVETDHRNNHYNRSYAVSINQCQRDYTNLRNCRRMLNISFPLFSLYPSFVYRGREGSAHCLYINNWSAYS